MRSAPLGRGPEVAGHPRDVQDAETISTVFLTAKFDRTGKVLIRLRAQVGAARFREMMAELRLF
jgi:hypothetical protein